jgi:hypothetical protein
MREGGGVVKNKILANEAGGFFDRWGQDFRFPREVGRGVRQGLCSFQISAMRVLRQSGLPVISRLKSALPALLGAWLPMLPAQNPKTTS